jgi:predicted AAA+ superfamily ATPase
LNEDITKALLENFVAQSLHNKGYQLAFWESDSMAKIDFLIRKDNQFLPIEIHSSDNTRSKSINVFKQKCDFHYAVKISSKNFEFSNQIKYVPYYAVFCL